MTHRIQEAFTELHQVTKEKSLFAGKKNEWICKLNPTEMGMIGEKLVSDVLGGAITRERAIGYNVIVGEKLIEVKMSRISLSNGFPRLSWGQIRPKDKYTHICFVAVYPEDVRAFLVPRNEININNLSFSHGTESEFKMYTVQTRKINELFPWMAIHEIL